MSDQPTSDLRYRIASGRTDLIFELGAVAPEEAEMTALLQQCAYFGDVSAIRYLLARGGALSWLGENFDLNGAAFHHHWQLCQFLIEQGADVNHPLEDTKETPLHAALCRRDQAGYNRVVQVLLSTGADPNAKTQPGIETGGFMRDCRTKGETPLHRAAAFSNEQTIQLLLDAGAERSAVDANGDSPLSWASWYLRPPEILRQLCFGHFQIRPQYRSMQENLSGDPFRSA